MHDKTLQLSLTLCDPMDCSLPDSSIRGILVLGKNTGVGRHYLLHRIFPTQGSNQNLLCLLLWQEGSSLLAPPGKPLVHLQILSIVPHCNNIHKD